MVSAKIQKLFKELTAKKARLDKLPPLSPEQQKSLDEWLSIEYTYTSNAIEGNTLTRQETAEVIEKGTSAVISGKPLKHQIEAINHNLAIKEIKKMAKNLGSHQSIKENAVKRIHKMLLTRIDPNPGKYRTAQVYIRGSTVIPPLPQKVPILMKRLVNDWLQTVQNEHPVKVAADLHFRFVKIHPFIDGNGRTARLLMNLVLLIHKYPLTIIRIEERQEYMDAIEQGVVSNDLESFYMVIGTAVQRSLDSRLSSAKGKTTKGKDKKLLKIGEVASQSGVSIPTIRHYLALKLIETSGKTAGGFMLFDRKVVEKIKEIKRLQKEERLKLSEMKQKLEI